TLLFIKQLSKEGVDVVYKKPKTHIILVNLLNLNLSGKEAENLLFQHKILVNRNQIPNDTHGPMTTSGMRLGTVGITNLSYTDEDIKKIS
ncbi:TPA: glycine hydroxymethyltransferase, partial [Streptococcus suis]